MTLNECNDLDSFISIIRGKLCDCQPEIVDSVCGVILVAWRTATDLERQRAMLENIKSIASKISPRQPTVRKILDPGQFEIQYLITSGNSTFSETKYSRHYANNIEECINFIGSYVLPYNIKYINKSTGLTVSLSILNYKYENVIAIPTISESDLIDELNRENERNLHNES